MLILLSARPEQHAQHTGRDASASNAAVVIACHGQQPAMPPTAGTVPTKEPENR
ncbi:MAG TPA: hypothetical protein VFM11_12185 [Burkholderiales bacterium]|nr:hypothetical protein [Burkholderiales bacterium]